MKNQIRFCLTLLFVFVLLTSIAAAQSSGGSFAITQSVVSNGGGTSSDAGNTFSLVGTIGQSVVGTSVNAPLSVSAGFWTSQTMTPTAAAATGRRTSDCSQWARHPQCARNNDECGRAKLGR
jgi:ABC-type phosphate transport system permease subunit